MGLLHPTAVQGSLRFCHGETRRDPKVRWHSHTRSRNAFTPFEAFPSLIAVSPLDDRCLRGVRLGVLRFIDLATDVRFVHLDSKARPPK